eukprot:3337209-Karenia_brevis.AAC.1
MIIIAVALRLLFAWNPPRPSPAPFTRAHTSMLGLSILCLSFRLTFTSVLQKEGMHVEAAQLPWCW